MSVFGVIPTSIGANAGLGETQEFYQDYFNNNFLPVEQRLGSLFSNNQFINDTAAQAGQMGRNAGIATSGMAQRGIGRAGIELTPEQQQRMAQFYDSNEALSEVNATNRAFRTLDRGFTDARQNFMGLGGNVAEQNIDIDALLQGFGIQRDVSQNMARMRKAMQQYIVDTTVGQSQYNADVDSSLSSGDVAAAIAGDIAGATAQGVLTRKKPSE